MSLISIVGGNSHRFFNILLLNLSLCFMVSCSTKVSSNDIPPPPPPKRSVKDLIKQAIPPKELHDYLRTAEKITNTRKHQAPFDTLDFDKVIAYDYEGNEEAFNSVFKNGHFVPIIEKQQALNNVQVDELIDNILTSKSTYEGGTAACFNPHLGIVFFKEITPVLVVDICLDCNALSSTLEIPASVYKAVSADGEEYTAAYGFSTKGKKKIISLAKQLQFYYANYTIK